MRRIYVEVTYWTTAINTKPFVGEFPAMATQTLPIDLPDDAELDEIEVNNEVTDLIARIRFQKNANKH